MSGGALVPLVLAIVAYAPGGAFDSYDDGTVVMFDVATVKIAEGYRAGQTLEVLLEPHTPEAALWNRPGETLAVSIDPAMLDSGDSLFAGAFEVKP